MQKEWEEKDNELMMRQLGRDGTHAHFMEKVHSHLFNYSFEGDMCMVQNNSKNNGISEEFKPMKFKYEIKCEKCSHCCINEEEFYFHSNQHYIADGCTIWWTKTCCVHIPAVIALKVASCMSNSGTTKMHCVRLFGVNLKQPFS